MGGHQLYEGSEIGPYNSTPIPVGAVVEVDKSQNDQKIRYPINGEDLLDFKTNRPYGWRSTNLSADYFKALVGCVEFSSKLANDSVEIIER